MIQSTQPDSEYTYKFILETVVYETHEQNFNVIYINTSTDSLNNKLNRY